MINCLRLFLLLTCLTSCNRMQYYYLANAPMDLFQSPSDQSLIMADINQKDTLITRKKFGRADGHFVRVVYRAGTGYVRSTGHEFLYSARYSPNHPVYYTGHYAGLDMSKPVHVRSYTRRTKSGKIVNVRAHTRNRPGMGTSRSSSSRSYRSSGSSYRSSGSSYRSSGSRSGGRH